MTISPRTESAEKAIAGEVIPADVMEAASKVADEALDDMSWNGCRDAAARAIMAERERCATLKANSLVTHIRPTDEGDSVEYAYKVCATGDDGAIPVYYGPHAHIPVSHEIVLRLIDAVEGELEGLDIDAITATAILSYTLSTPNQETRP